MYLAVAMTEGGAAGETRAAIRKMTTTAPGEDPSGLTKKLDGRRDIELSIANALWSDSSQPLAPAFVQRSRDSFGADATTLDFRKPDAANTINAWVRRATHDKIPGIVTPEMRGFEGHSDQRRVLHGSVAAPVHA